MVFYVPNIAVCSITQGLPIRHSDGREKQETIQLWISFAILGRIFEMGEVISCGQLSFYQYWKT